MFKALAMEEKHSTQPYVVFPTLYFFAKKPPLSCDMILEVEELTLSSLTSIHIQFSC